jgi:DNA-directed RNA polymerase specialized sigma24 family protein
VKNTILPNDLWQEPRRGDEKQRRQWDLTPKAFDQFLSLLDLDRDRAGESYEALRRNLIQLFIWRGCRDPESHADETINRVIRKIDEGEEVRDVIDYAHGVARRLLLEVFKKQEREQIGIDELPPLVAQPEEQDDETGVLCLRRCLNRLPEESRQLIVLYYQGEKSAKIENRKRLAEGLRVTLGALRDSMVFGKGFTLAINLSSFKAGVRAEAGRLTPKGVIAQIKSKSLSLSRIGGFNDLKTTLKRQFDGDAAMLKQVGARLQQASKQRGVSLLSPTSAPGKEVASAFAPGLLGEKSRSNSYTSFISYHLMPASNLTTSPVRTKASHTASSQLDPITAGVLAGIAMAALAYVITKYAEEKAEDIEENPDTGVSQMGECRSEARRDRNRRLNNARGDFFREAGCWGQYAIDEAACLLLPL